MKTLGILLFVLLLTIVGCNKENDSIEISIAETGCMNDWDDYMSDNNDYQVAVEAFLEDNKISVFRVYSKIYSEGPFCYACSCPTGRLIIASIAEQDFAKAEALGFTLYENED